MNWLINGITVYLHAFFFLFCSGLLIQLSLNTLNSNENKLYNIGPIILNSFVISIITNGITAGILSYFNLGLDATKYVLFIFDGLLIKFIYIRVSRAHLKNLFRFNETTDKIVAIAIIMVFLLMAYQGGLLDIMADGWWHMAISNRMVHENTVLLTNHPFVGIESDSFEIFYPPLWHLHLALIQESSGLALPVIWHFIASVNISLLLLAYYLLAKILSKDNKIALLSVFLYIFLVGGLNTYFRVSSWPGNVSYILLYYAFYLAFKIIADVNSGNSGSSYSDIFSRINTQTACLLALACAGMVGLHGVELVLFVSAIGAYLAGISVHDFKDRRNNYIRDRKLISFLFVICLVCGTAAALLLLPNHIDHVLSSPRSQEPYLNYIIPVMLVIYGILGILISRLVVVGNKKQIILFVFLSCLILLYLQIADIEHIKSLFFRSITGNHIPRDFFDQFNNRVFLPFWDHQLRGAILFSGLISILLGCFLLYTNPNRLNIFIGANAILVLLVLTSPYLFTFMSFLIPLKSVYRIHMLLFSPLIISTFINMLLFRDSNMPKPKQNIVRR